MTSPQLCTLSWSTGFSAKGCIARKVIPLDPDPLCCVQCGGLLGNVAHNWSCMHDLYARKREITTEGQILCVFLL
jgi:hypothetical protein